MINQKYHFDITPHIVKQLGEQLVSDEITALLELIKNSFVPRKFGYHIFM